MSRRWRSMTSVALAATLALPILSRGSLAAAVDWPPSPDIVVGEVVTGGATAVDEWFEIHNGGDMPVQLDGLEVVYITASGATVSRKHAWSDRQLRPGGHLLLANADGVFAGLADHVYSGGLSATGGTLAVRVVGGGVIDSLSWGDAASAYVEGTAGSAPSAGRSLERRPGGTDGNGRDTNDNASDTLLNSMPIPDGSSGGADPTPEPTPEPTPKPTSQPEPTSEPEPTPDPTPAPTTAPTPQATSDPTSEPTPVPTTAPTPVPTPEPTPSPSVRPTPPPTATPPQTPVATPTPDPTATPSPTPTPRPTATPSPTATPRPPATPVPTPPRTSVEIADARDQGVGARPTVTGVVTAQPGRILGDRSMAIQDGSGGVIVRLPESVRPGDLSRGAIVEVTGELAAPYGNLEMRPKDGDLRIVGSGGLPDPVTLGSVDITEDTEGLLARLTGTITEIDRRESGALAIGLEDEHGVTVVYLHAETKPAELGIRKGQRIRATGIVGQRASRSGADDGHRLWPRGPADIETLRDGGPQGTPRPGSDPGAKPPRSVKSIRIRDVAVGMDATIVGTVTSSAGLIDSEGRRVTVQDRSGAILVRYPADAKVPGVGRRIRASGDIGTWYDSVQLEAEVEPRVLGRGNAAPVILRRPPDASDEWRLVSVTVRIEDVQRSGDTWRAEASMGAGGDLPIAGLAGSGIGADLLEAGRSARIVGIVKRAHPSASDQRFAVAPRSTKDIRLGRLTSGRDAIDEAGDGAGDDTGSASSGDPSGDGDGVVASASLAALGKLGDAMVRAGGRVTAVVDRTLRLDDGTGQATVRLADEVVIDPPIHVGEVVNVTGRVRLRDGVRPELTLRAAIDLLRASSLTSPDDATSDGGPVDAADGAFLAATIGGDAPGGDAGDAGPTSAVPDHRVLLLMLLASFSAAMLCAATAVLAWPRLLARARARERPEDGPETVQTTPGEVPIGLR